MPTKKQSPNGTIDFTRLGPGVRRYEWFEVPQGDDEEAEPLRVKVQRLTNAEVAEIPAGKALLKDVLTDYRHCFVAWNLVGMVDGEVVPVPPPAEMDAASFAAVLERVLFMDQQKWLYNTIKHGATLKLLAEGKTLSRSASTPDSPPAGDSSSAT